MGSLRIRPITAQDTGNVVRWRNAPEVRNNFFLRAELTAEQHLNWLHKVVEPGLCRQFIIEAELDGEMADIGTVFIKNVDQGNGKGEFGIFIGEFRARGRGYGYQATVEMLKFAFGVMGLHRVYLSVFADNVSAVHVYEKAGFVAEGVLRQDYYTGTAYRDVILMGILEPEWERR